MITPNPQEILTQVLQEYINCLPADPKPPQPDNIMDANAQSLARIAMSRYAKRWQEFIIAETAPAPVPGNTTCPKN